MIKNALIFVMVQHVRFVKCDCHFILLLNIKFIYIVARYYYLLYIYLFARWYPF